MDYADSDSNSYNLPFSFLLHKFVVTTDFITRLRILPELYLLAKLPISELLCDNMQPSVQLLEQ